MEKLVLKVITDAGRIDEWLDVALLAIDDPTQDDRENMRMETKTALKNLEGPDIIYYLEDGGEIIATALSKETDYDFHSDSVTLFHIAVLEKHRKKGVGKILMEGIFEDLKRRERRFALLSTNTSGEFYEKCGMRKWGEIPGFNENWTRYFYYINLSDYAQ